MIVLLELIAVGVFLLLAVHLLFGFRLFGARQIEDRAAKARDISPAQSAAEHLRELSNAQADLKARYPVVFAMLGGYLNAHSISEAGGLESAVKQMVADWTPRREEVKTELVRLLAENASEEEVRAIVLSCADATFEEEGYRNWLIWLLGRFNAA
ncbi:MAG: hypothetical protein HXY23_03645 [Parvularculaceae bacterium]|jgi:predicted negative regulator of RcsB-dependent stress response|nr:hypothetical protein [Parvularculaceae bacterium]